MPLAHGETKGHEVVGDGKFVDPEKAMGKLLGLIGAEKADKSRIPVGNFGKPAAQSMSTAARGTWRNASVRRLQAVIESDAIPDTQ